MKKKLKRKIDKKEYKPKHKLERFLVISLIVFSMIVALIPVFFMNHVGEKIATKEYKGELFSLFGPQANGIYLPANCEDAELEQTWNSIFMEGSDSITIITGTNCTNYFLYKILDNNLTYALAGEKYNSSCMESETISAIYGNFSETAINYTKNIDREFLDSFTSESILPDENGLPYIMTVFYYEGSNPRVISNASEANNEFHSIFKLENGSWTENSEAFLNSSLKQYISKRVSEDYIAYYNSAQRPIDLTQIKNIENQIVNSSGKYIKLSEYFANLGCSNKNLSFSYSISPTGEVSVYNTSSFFSDYKIYFNTNVILNGTYKMNITLMHPGIASLTSNNFDVFVKTCIDSDSLNKYVNGSAKNSSDIRIDYCSNEQTVIEYYCSYGDILSQIYSCDSASEICSDGKCITKEDYYCEDSDGGMSYEIYGETNGHDYFSSNAEYSKEDYCINDSNLMEYYCNSTGVVIGGISILKFKNSSEVCLSNSFCYSGACLGCVDSDEKNYLVRGIVRTASEQKTDECLNETSLKEYYCEGDAGKETNVTCGSGYICSDGRCARRNQATLLDNPDYDELQNHPSSTLSISNPFPQITTLSVQHGKNQTFSVGNSEYDSLEWYLDGTLIKINANSYIAGNLSSGNHTIMVKIIKNGAVETRTWDVVVGEEEKGSGKTFIFYIILVTMVIIIIIVLLMIILSVFEKMKNSRVPNIGFGVSIKEK